MVGLPGSIVGPALATMLALGLAGCVDADIDITLTGPTTAVAVTTQSLNADYRVLDRMNTARSANDPRRGASFCATGALTDTVDGGATCVLVETGRFPTLTLGSPESLLVFTRIAPDKVRIALALSDLRDALLHAGAPQTEAVLSAMFAGHSLTLGFAGGAVVSTNMTLSPDGRAARQIVPLHDILAAPGTLPEEYYAIVEAPAR